MKNFKNYSLLSISALSLALSFSSLNASDDLSVFNKDFSKAFEKKELISSNVSFLKNTILKKIQKAEAKLEEYRVKFENSQNEAEEQKWMKKIDKLENLLAELKEIL